MGELQKRQAASSRCRRWLVALVLALGPLGCGISPKPDPPNSAPILNSGSVAQERTGVGLIGPWVDLKGAPGSAAPPGAMLRLYRLETTDPRTQTVVAEDGSFLLSAAGLEGTEIRLQVVDDDLRSNPLDVVVGAPGTPLTPAVRSLGHCLRTDPPAELELATRHVVRLWSTCEQDVVLSAPRLRRPLPELSLGADRTWPSTLRAGEELTFEVALTAAPQFDEEVFFVEATAPSTDRRPITVRPP